MAKGILKNYTFNTAAKTITLTDIATARLDKLALITDVTTNKVLYNFADSTIASVTVATNVITLSALQGGEANGNKLRIDYDLESSDTSAFADTTQPVSATSLPLPTGAATATKQDTSNTSLSSIDSKITAVNTGAVTVSSSALPTGAATVAKQPALGTAGTASVDVITVQGKAAMTPLLVDPSGVTSPVSLASVPSHAVTNTGTFAAQAAQSGVWTVQPGNTANTTAWKVDGSAVTQPVSGSVTTTPPSNASTNTAQIAGTTTDTNSGNKSAGTQRVVLATDQPALTNALKVDGSATTQPVSGTVTANAGTNLSTAALALDATLTGGTQKTKLTDGIFNASVSPFGALSASIDPSFLFLETFDGSTIDVTNKWTSGGTVPPTQNGSILINPSTTASATSALVSQPTFAPNSNTSLGIFIQLEVTTIALGNYRFWGYGTAPSGVGTAAAPIQDGLGFEVDTSGVLRASVYASGTRIFTQALTVPVDGLSHLYVVTVNTGTILFYKDTFATPLASTALVPTVQTLPYRLVSLNTASVTGTPTLVGTQAGIADFTHQAQSISDGMYYWRKATIKQASTAPAAADTALVVALSPNTGRVPIMITASVASTATAETLITITKSVGLAATGTSTSTTITTGKRFRIQSINASVRNSTGTTAGLATMKLHAAVAGATTTASPLQFTSSVALPAATTSVLFPSIIIPDGLEIDSNSATNTYGVTITHPQWVTGSVVATFDISIIGYEY